MAEETTTLQVGDIVSSEDYPGRGNGHVIRIDGTDILVSHPAWTGGHGRGSHEWHYFPYQLVLLAQRTVNPSATETMDTLNELTPMQKEHWDSDSQALYRVGIIDSCFDVDSGKALKMLVKLNYRALAVEAEKMIAEREAKDAKDKKTK